MLEALFVLPITLEFLKAQRLRLSQGEIPAKQLVQKEKEVALDAEGDETEHSDSLDLQEDEDFQQSVIHHMDQLCDCIQSLP